MIGFISAVSASLAIFVLISVVTLVAYLDTITPKYGFKKISELHYLYIITDSYLNDSKLTMMQNFITKTSERDTISLESLKPDCNYGFNRDERKATEIVTYNYVQLIQYVQKSGSATVLPINRHSFDVGVNYCHVDLMFKKQD